MHVVNLTAAMNDGPWRTLLVTGSVSETEGDMEYYAAERGVAVTHLPGLSREISFLDDLHTLWALWRLFRRERPDVVHTHTAKAGTLGRLAAILAGVPVRVHTFHGHVLGGGYFSRRKTRFFLEIERQLARGTQCLVVLTKRQEQEMSHDLRVAEPARFAVVPLGLELERFAAMDRAALRPAARAAMEVPDDAFAVGIVGRLVPIKNHELFLAALAALRRRRPDAVGVVVGAGEREAELKPLAASLGLDGAVRWLGWRRDLPDIYAALDVVALTSHDEGTPVALLEALAAGARVVARDVGGVREVLDDAGAGRVVPRAMDAEAWAGVLAEEGAVVGREGAPGAPDDRALATRRRIAEQYSVGRLSADLGAIYRRELGRV